VTLTAKGEPIPVTVHVIEPIRSPSMLVTQAALAAYE
jgi:hypothetical protein